ncbi:armadillo-type protein [Jimgerdemannia flammicorona]|uniref:Armadillo-type protein n=1 Tax=Jimgerdemannia flammicorona TaxID=994334 RepID=A0A433A2L4_9FUNG|nr:armadillo-type protein [Jimgerdemannia flammicorona]
MISPSILTPNLRTHISTKRTHGPHRIPQTAPARNIHASKPHPTASLPRPTDSNQTRITDILQLDVLERLKAFLMASEAAQLQYETAWVVTNIAAGNTPQTQAIVDAGFIDTLLLSLGTKGALSLKTQVAWALSNIAGESSALREHLMHQNALGAVVEVLNNVRHNVAAAQDSSQVDQMATIRARGIYADVRVLVWTVANMCRGGFKAKEMWWLYIPAFETLTEMLLLEDIEICTDACWGLSRILSNMHKVDEFLDHLKFSPRLCPRLVECCCSNNINLQTPALRTIINIASGPNQHISTLLEAHPFPTLILFLDNQNSPGLRRDALLTIANIAAGDEKHVACVLDFPGLMDRVEEMVSVVGSEPEGEDIDDEDLGMGTSRRRYRRGRHDDGDEEEEWKVVQEAVWIVSNVTSLGSVQKVGELLHTHPLLPRRLTYLIQHQQTPTMTLIKALDAITNIISRTQPPHLPEFVHLGALETAMLIGKRGGRGSLGVVERCEALVEKSMQVTGGDVTQLVDGMNGNVSIEMVPRRLSLLQQQEQRRALAEKEARRRSAGTSLGGELDGDVMWVEEAVGRMSILGKEG